MSIASDEAAIRKATQDWARAIGDKNAAAMSRFFTEDVVTFDLAPPLKQTGLDRKVLEGWFKTWDGPIGYELTDQVVTVSHTLAVARSLDHMTGRKTDGENVDVWTRSTVVLRKEEGAWKVMHVHSSVPFYMDGSLKAAVDLKP
jgi:ketosteroid isomerase-like protein